MFNSLIPLGVALALQNLTIPMDITLDGGILFKLAVKDIHLATVNGPTIKKFAYVEGTNKVEIAFGGIDIDMTMNAKLLALHFIPFEASRIQIENATL